MAAGAAVAFGCCLVLTGVLSGCSVGSLSAAAPARSSGTPPARVTRTVGEHSPFAVCEQRLERKSRSLPTVAIVGASYTVGVGAGKPSLSWAAVLARKLRWNAVIYGVSGAGYVEPGAHDLGPVRHMLDAEQLRVLAPALVIIQAGHDDGRMSPSDEERQVRRTLQLVRAEAPNAQIALLTVFTLPGRPPSAALVRTDKEIVRTARATDPAVIIMDPLTGHWKFAREHDGLHPSAAGDAWIARKVAGILRTHGIDPRPRTTIIPVVCDRAVHGSGATSSA
jgi:lysophospholipase L1-like esterase